LKRQAEEDCDEVAGGFTVTAENAVSQEYVEGEERRNVIAISFEFAYSFVVLIQNVELPVELKALPVLCQVIIQ
jgi:hypothetical protein